MNICGTADNKKIFTMKKTFENPLLSVIELKNEDVIATSGDASATVDNPWGSNTEENW